MSAFVSRNRGAHERRLTANDVTRYAVEFAGDFVLFYVVMQSVRFGAPGMGSVPAYLVSWLMFMALRLTMRLRARRD